jgi:RimJ/RimL family protein N-acetyltransferase
MIRFRELTPDDLPLLLEWLQRPHVKQWWDDGDSTLEQVARRYSSRTETVKRYLLLLTEENETERAAGYFQYYLTADGAGVDQFLANASDLGKGLGTAALRSFLDLVRERSGADKIIVDPSPNNLQAIRCYEKVGFRYVQTRTGAKGTPVYLMESVGRCGS